ncbi:MAG: hypothetical protein ABW139_00625 [Candidatus Thiodiazotropha sp. DIVDIV]
MTVDQSIIIPSRPIKLLKNTGLIVLEITRVLTGGHLVENDIERLSDEYGRYTLNARAATNGIMKRYDQKT